MKYKVTIRIIETHETYVEAGDEYMAECMAVEMLNNREPMVYDEAMEVIVDEED